MRTGRAIRFKSLLCRHILLRMIRARLQPGQAEPAQQLADSPFVQFNRIAPDDLFTHIDTAPAHNPIPRRVRSLNHQRLDLAELLGPVHGIQCLAAGDVRSASGVINKATALWAQRHHSKLT